MPKRTSRDFNQIAKAIIDTVGEASEQYPEKNPAAVALGHLGGLKGGPARARRLSKKERTKIASKAAKARWKKK